MLTAIEYLSAKEKQPAAAFNVLAGDEAFLVGRVLKALRASARPSGEDLGATKTLSGPQADLADVMHLLTARSLFSKERPLVVVTEADAFVTEHRAKLEAHASSAKGEGILVLQVDSFPKNTKLYGLVDKLGLLIDCKGLEGAAVATWLKTWSEEQYKKKLDKDAAQLMVELVGGNLGVLDRELAKLVDWSGDAAKLTAEHVHEVVGGWKTKTAWEMLDLALDGNAPEALRQLHRLLAAGEQPVGVLAQVGSTLRRFNAAATLVGQAEAEGRRITPGDALREAGAPPFTIRNAEPRLKRLGRVRASQLLRWVLQADLDLKGDSPLPPRVVLEQLLVRIAQQ